MIFVYVRRVIVDSADDSCTYVQWDCVRASDLSVIRSCISRKQCFAFLNDSGLEFIGYLPEIRILCSSQAERRRGSILSNP